MSDNGKGDKQRKRQVSYAEYERRWAIALGENLKIQQKVTKSLTDDIKDILNKIENESIETEG